MELDPSFIRVILLLACSARVLVPSYVSFIPTLFDAGFFMTLAAEDLLCQSQIIFRVSCNTYIVIALVCPMEGGKLRILLLCHFLLPPLWYLCYLPCVVLDLRRRAFSFLPLSMMLVVAFLIWLLLHWDNILLFPFVGCFYHKKVLNFVKSSFLNLLTSSCDFFPLHSINVCITDFYMLSHPCIPGINQLAHYIRSF